MSVLWSLSDTLCVERVAIKQIGPNTVQRIKIYTNKKAPNEFRMACLAQCLKLDEATTDTVECFKIKVWDTLAEGYTEETPGVDIITILELLYFDNKEWLDKINPNFQRWIDSMTMKMIDCSKTDAKFAREIGGKFVQILNKVLYDENRNNGIS